MLVLIGPDGAMGGRRRAVLGAVFAASLLRMRAARRAARALRLLRGSARAAAGAAARARAGPGRARRPGRERRRSTAPGRRGEVARGRGPRASWRSRWSCCSCWSGALPPGGRARGAARRPGRPGAGRRGPAPRQRGARAARAGAPRRRAGVLRVAGLPAVRSSWSPRCGPWSATGLPVHSVIEDEQPGVFADYRVPGTPVRRLPRGRGGGGAGAREHAGADRGAHRRWARSGWVRRPEDLIPPAGRLHPPGGRSWPRWRASPWPPWATAPRPRHVRCAAPSASAAGWYGFCGHYFTTGSCPSPDALPRVDARGHPVRPSDGRPIDDLGRLIDATGFPVDGRGAPLLAADGSRLPPAPRTRLCEDWVPERHGVGRRAPGRVVPLLQRADPQARRLLLHQPDAHQRRRGAGGLLPPGPAGLLRPLHRHGRAVLSGSLLEIGVAAAAFIAGVSAAWSP